MSMKYPFPLEILMWVYLLLPFLLLNELCISAVIRDLTLFILGFLGWCSTGWGGSVFHLHPVTPLSLKSDDSNFVQYYFEVGSIFWGKKNRDQIDNDVSITSSLL